MNKRTEKTAKKGLQVTEDIEAISGDAQGFIPKEREEGSDNHEEAFQNSNEFVELYDESMKNIQEGEVVEGVLIQVDKEHVLVDIGYKSEGQIPLAEFTDSKGNLTVKADDRIDVLLLQREDENGGVILSRKKVARARIWNRIKEIYENNGTIRGKIISRVKGGFLWTLASRLPYLDPRLI